MGLTIKHPIIGNTTGKIDGKEIKDSTGKTTGIIEGSTDDSDEWAGCLVGAVFKAAFFVLILPFYGILGAICLLSKEDRRLGYILTVLMFATWITMIAFYLVDREVVGSSPYSIVQMRHENIMNMLLWIWGVYNFVIQPAIVKISGVLDNGGES